MASATCTHEDGTVMSPKRRVFQALLPAAEAHERRGFTKENGLSMKGDTHHDVLHAIWWIPVYVSPSDENA